VVVSNPQKTRAIAEELRLIDAELGQVGLRSAEVKRLMTIPGVDATVALSIVAAVGDVGRFRSPERLVSYLGVNLRVRQSGGQPASHGRITKQGGRISSGSVSRGSRLTRRDRPPSFARRS
jgi:transposase